ncbi:MAG: ABC transporter permease [Deltaproteobacteria bacterium]|nr:ABC transporter permease [Deltaproteobacteria bacterium]MBL7084277.1 ABC transporter permease [Candidatus Aminicenantes bacterium]
MRSLLTSLGIIIGVSGVIVMSAIGEGSQELIKQEIDALGTNVIIVFPGAGRTGGVRHGAGSLNRFTFDDIEKIKREATLVKYVSPAVRSGGQIIAGENNWSCEVNGVSTDYFRIKNWPVEYGAHFTVHDVQTKRKVALLGKTVADKLFPDKDPTGEKIRIRNVPFTILGVLKEKGQIGMGQDQDDIVLAPSTTVLYRLKGGRYIDLINASARSADQLEEAEEEIRTILRESHRLDDGEDDDFTIQNQTEITEAVTETSKIMTLFLGTVASIALIVGGIGIMNIMLVSVTERTREIGIRLSVGARGSDILVQFLAEAVALSVTGGLFGILLSLAIVFGVNEFTEYSALIKIKMILISVVFSAAIGIIFGFFPARKAAGLNPIDALRHE